LALKKDQGPGKDGSHNSDQIEQRLDTLDRRLDDIDSMITAIAERAMDRPIRITLTCPSCGKIIEIGMVGTERMPR
jgi:hypothetical protein